MIPVAILAGGLATRLRPITETIPKALIEISGEPFIFHQLRYLREQRIQKVVLCIGYLGEMIVDIVGDGSKFGLSVSYSMDGPVLLGTGGAIKQAVPQLDDSFFVIYGDSFLPIDYNEVYKAFLEGNKLAMMTVLKNDNRWDKSNVLFENGMLLEYNKLSPRSEMSYIDYGLAILPKSAFEQYNERQIFDLAELYHDFSVQGKLAGFEVHQRFYEIGSHDGIKETEEYFISKQKGKL